MGGETPKEAVLKERKSGWRACEKHVKVDKTMTITITSFMNINMLPILH